MSLHKTISLDYMAKKKITNLYLNGLTDLNGQLYVKRALTGSQSSWHVVTSFRRAGSKRIWIAGFNTPKLQANNAIIN